MEHDEAVRQKATEKYLLNELDPELQDQFEEHMFDCQDCALDVRAAAMFVEQTKAVLAQPPVTSEVRVPVRAGRSERGWFAWLRPAFAVPILALLLAVIGYQNLVTYPHLMQAANEPHLGPWTSVNISTRAASDSTAEPTIVKIGPGEGFNLLVNRPPDSTYSSYILELYNPAGRLQWAGRLPVSSPDDARSISVPGGELKQGNYTLAIRKVSPTGEDIEKHPIELQIQK